MGVQASFFFHGDLQDFLPWHKKGAKLAFEGAYAPALKDTIEAFGVPHPEIGGILLEGRWVSFPEKVAAGKLIEVFPHGLVPPEAQILLPALSPPGPPCFVLDVHLGALARFLRLLGFDALYENQFTDQQIAQLAGQESRIVLTRDVGLLKQKQIEWGYWLRSQQPKKQLQEVLQRYDLSKNARPFSRCVTCNGQIHQVAKELIEDRLPPKTKYFFQEFYQCSGCLRIYWKGSHYDHMKAFIKDLFPSKEF